MEKARIVTTSGMGNFLNPPTHPEHTTHVETDLNRKKENRDVMSLTVAAESDWHNCQQQAKKILADWKTPDINSPEIQDWIHRIMGYFKDCYIPVNGKRTASDLLIQPMWNPVARQNHHAGVLHIRDYYPHFILTAEHVKNAYWGTTQTV